MSGLLISTTPREECGNEQPYSSDHGWRFRLFCFEPVGANCAGLGLAGSQTTAASPADVALSERMSEVQCGNMALARAAFEKAVKLAPGNAGGSQHVGLDATGAK